MIQKIDGFSIDNILQIFALEKKTQTIRVTNDHLWGFLDLNNGDLVHAEAQDRHGLDAAMEILSWDDVQIEILPFRKLETTISKSVISILLEVSKIKDEKRESLEEKGQDLLAEAILLAENQQYKESHQKIVSYLKINKNDAVGWIWYARIQGNVDNLKKALQMARKCDPEHPLVTSELAIVKKALPHLSDTTFRKCFFCWAPINKDTVSCPSCGGHLVFSKESLSKAGQADTSVLHSAKERYERVLKRSPRNLAAIYCLGLIHMNQLNFKEALAYLDKAAKRAPERAAFANQLQLVLDHLAQQSIKEQDIPGTNSEEPASINRSFDKKLILVVEDSSTTRKVVSITLSRQGFRVAEAEDGLEALSKISEERPDLVMLDVILPKMDGYKILSILKSNKEFKDIPVIMLTSKDGFINKMKGKMGGASAYLTKPFNPEHMIEEIRKYI